MDAPKDRGTEWHQGKAGADQSLLKLIALFGLLSVHISLLISFMLV